MSDDSETFLRAARVVGNRREWVDGRMSEDQFRSLLDQEAAETPGGWAQLAASLAGIAQLGITMVADAAGVGLEEALTVMRAAVVSE